MNDLELMVGQDENILWKGKPNKKCFILESIFNKMLPFALIWALFDSFAIKAALFNTEDRKMFIYLIVFLIFHLMPVWIYLGGVILSFRKYRNTKYIITDRGIYVSGGTFTYTYEMKPFTDLSHVNIHRGIFDQMLGVGDVISVCSHSHSTSGNHSSGGINICDIDDYQHVFTLVKQLQTDIYSDTMYPNDLRPESNHGYNTKYTPRDRF